MLVAAFFSWWYGSGWKQVISGFRPRLQNVSAAFSVSQLIKTLFAPWRRIISYPGASLAERWRAWGDNLFSRCIGFVVRIFVLIGALLSLVAVAAASILEIILWPLLPPLVPILVVAGFIA